MILQQLQQYLRIHSPVSLAVLATHFQCDPNALRGMLQTLSRKQRVRQLPTQSCGGCHSCDPESFELYEWIQR